MCYLFPLTGAIITSVLCKKNKNFKLWQLNLMFFGGAIFGVVDHWWNGELFLISENLINDLLLGAAITLVIILFWLAIILLGKKKTVLAGNKIT